ncbi:MAG: crotonobetainyl-CoA hydratase [Proteobacteria bacterium]|nr:crotonobetainyl-CoA hydratase [Pseudomonadota bacterium]
MSQAVRTERRGAVLEITLDRPKANAIDRATSRELGDTFLGFRDDPELRVAIITGAGERIFSAGWDLKAAAEGEEGLDTDYGPGGFAGLTEIFDLNKPVIAALNGAAVGGGFEIALACDLIVAAEHVEVFLPEAKLGILASGGGIVRLARRLPRALAMEMLLTGRRMSAEEALRWGLFNAVVPAAELMATARALAEEIVAAAPLAVEATLEMLRDTEAMSVEESFAAMHGGQLDTYRRLLASEDAKEGPRAFAEKRDPVWQGR